MMVVHGQGQGNRLLRFRAQVRRWRRHQRQVVQRAVVLVGEEQGLQRVALQRRVVMVVVPRRRRGRRPGARDRGYRLVLEHFQRQGTVGRRMRWRDFRVVVVVRVVDGGGGRGGVIVVGCTARGRSVVPVTLHVHRLVLVLATVVVVVTIVHRRVG